jgi:molybdenum cofactor synthesis domain-containing protein
LAAVIAGENLEPAGEISEGKIELRAAADGIFCVNSKALLDINETEDYSVACLPNYFPVARGDSVAGLRIIPLTTKIENAEAAVAVAKKNFPVFEVKPFLKLKAGIIVTGGEIYSGQIKDKFEPILREKVKNFGGEVLGAVICDDDVSMIKDAIRGFLNQQAGLIFLTGGMSVDPDDVTPTAIAESGATVVFKGLPMQPGNMLNLAYLDSAALIGVPGASLHMPVTSLDVFLPRVFAGLRIEKRDAAAMGEGGYCVGRSKCFDSKCSYPICYFGGYIGGYR